MVELLEGQALDFIEQENKSVGALDVIQGGNGTVGK